MYNRLPNLNSFKYWRKFVFVCLFLAPLLPITAQSPELFSDNEYSWYLENEDVLIYQLDMASPDHGFASSRGMGKNIAGAFLEYKFGQWHKIKEFPYSDFPAIHLINDHLYAIHHLTHFGFYKPVMYKYFNNSFSEISLPEIKFDEADYVMIFGMAGTSNSNIQATTQKGHILKFDGKTWQEIASPVTWNKEQKYFEQDIFPPEFVDDNLGWAGVFGGRILKFENSQWEIDTTFAGFENSRIWRIDFLNTQFGIAVGHDGFHAVFREGSWELLSFPRDINFYAVKIFSENDYWIGGQDRNGTILIHYRNGKFFRQEGVENKSYGLINDLDGFYNQETDIHKIWLALDTGIATCTKENIVTFQDVTKNVNLPADGNGAVFSDLDNDNDVDLLILSDGVSPLRLCVNENLSRFHEINFSDYGSSGLIVKNAAIADADNDGLADLITLDKDGTLALYHQKSSLIFEKTIINKLPLNPAESVWSTLKLADFNHDGYIDIFVGNEKYGLNIFYNNTFGRFEIPEILDIPVIPGGRLLGITVYDYDRNGLADVTLVYNSEINEMWLQEKSGTYVKSDSAKIQGKFNDDDFVCIFTDIDLDNLPDNYTYRRDHTPFIQSEGNKIDLPLSGPHYFWETGVAAFADINNDFYPDLFASNKLWLDEEGRTFEDITKVSAIKIEGNPSFADFDNDNDLDLFIGGSTDESGQNVSAALYKNNSTNQKMLKLKFDLRRQNRFGIGSRIFVKQNGNNINFKQIGFDGNPLITECISPVQIPIPSSLNNLEIEIILPDQTRLSKQITDFARTHIITDVSALGAAWFDFLRNLRFSIHYFNPFVELSKIIIFFILLIWFIKYSYAAKKIKLGSRVLLAGLLLIFNAFLFVYFGYEPYSVTSLTGYLASLWLITFVPYFLNLVIEKYQKQNIAHFKILRKIGEGGMGKVYLAKNRHTSGEVALKILHPEVTESKDGLKRFRQECDIGATLDHPNIVKFLETGEFNGQHFLAMEYLKGKTLRSHIKEGRIFSPVEITEFGIKILEALRVIHAANIVHRDIKSDNIFILESGEIKLMDFGLAKSAIFSMATQTNMILGTLSYMSPQQAIGEKVDQRTDIYSVGVILYEMATGQLPFSASHDMAMIYEIFNNKPKPVNELIDNFPVQLGDCILKAMSKESEGRFQTSTEFAERLKQLNKVDGF